MCEPKGPTSSHPVTAWTRHACIAQGAYLCAALAESAEKVVVVAHQQRLADGSKCLLLDQICGLVPQLWATRKARRQPRVSRASLNDTQSTRAAPSESGRATCNCTHLVFGTQRRRRQRTRARLCSPHRVAQLQLRTVSSSAQELLRQVDCCTLHSRSALRAAQGVATRL
jgi:hypothetical protein